LRALRGQLASSLPELAAALGQDPGGPAASSDLGGEVAQAFDELLGMAERLELARPFLDADFSAEVAALNGWIEAQRGELGARLTGFEAAFPSELVAREPGFALLRMHLNAIEPLVAADWEPRWKALRRSFGAGYPADAMVRVQKVKALAARFPRATVDSCRSPLAPRLAEIDANLTAVATRVAAADEAAGREAAKLHLPRERCVAKLGAAGTGSAPSGDADEIRRRRLMRIREGAQVSRESSDYHSPEARRERELEEQRRREQERRERVLQAERERAWRASMESFGRGDSPGQPSSDLDPVPASPSRSVPETVSDRPARSECAVESRDVELCELMGGPNSVCGLPPHRGVDAYGAPYSCEQFCRCRVLEPR
jgi:hypothetical protein